MKYFILTTHLLLSLYSFGQHASFKEIKLKSKPRYYNTQENTIVFPIVVTGNPHIENLINTQIKAEMFSEADSARNIKDLLDERIETGATNMSYEATFNRHGLLSFFIYSEGCGAHCSSSKTYFNFDLENGKKLSINDLFREDKIDSFRNMVRKDKINALNEYKEDELGSLQNQYIDSSTYDWAVSQVDEYCINTISIEVFSVYDFTLLVIDDCEFPNAVRSQQPILELRYPYNDIDGLLRPAFTALLK